MKTENIDTLKALTRKYFQLKEESILADLRKDRQKFDEFIAIEEELKEAVEW